MIRAALLFALLASPAAFAGHRPFTLSPVHSPAAVEGPVNYYGGPVIAHVKVHAIYWGSGVDAGTQNQLKAFYTGLVSSSYIDQLAEFSTKVRSIDGREGTQQEIGRGSFGESITITPVNRSASLTQADIEHELEAQIESGAIPKPDADSLYMIHFPDGISVSISFGRSCESWLADHEVYRSAKFGSVYYALFPCDSYDSSSFSTLTYAASHELEEAISDPMSPLQNEPNVFPAGWLRADGQEIGDLCTSARSTLHAGGVDYSVNPAWLNSKGGCNVVDFQ
ncbi:MAG: hypothetical protein ACXVB9_10455 [Bdellovibrionota bacterium]